MSEQLTVVDDESFTSEVLESDKPVLVDFWAPWCGPCKMITPMLEEIAETYTGRIKFAKLNIDENNDTPSKYGVRAIPTLLLFKDGEAGPSQVGAVTKSQLTAFLDKNI